MNILKSLFIAIALALTASAQTTQSLRNVQSHHAATFTSDSGTAYTAGDSVGVSQILTNIADTGRLITLDSIKVVDSANQKKTGHVLFFKGSAPTLTNNAAFAWGSSLTNLVGMVDINAADYVTFDSKAVATRTFVGVRMNMASDSKNLSVVFVTADTPTYGASGTLTLDFHFSN